ncbi:MAG: DUF1634 domain-containing protein [Myxococcaceae bacterium]|nr:DUF1634 domain-containing protein [Myxococcaceae bacterium]
MERSEEAAQARDTSGPLAPGGVELLISTLLRSGVVLSVALIGVGVTLSFFHNPERLTSRVDLTPLLSPEHGPSSLEAVLVLAREVRGQAFVMMGLLVMMAVPVLRVLIAFFSFRQQRDRAFVRMTSVVLTLLALSILLGRATD